MRPENGRAFQNTRVLCPVPFDSVCPFVGFSLRQGDFVFGEWRIADRHKAGLYDRMDFYLDTNTKNHPAIPPGSVF